MRSDESGICTDERRADTMTDDLNRDPGADLDEASPANE
jgi:hypothetical protein